LGSGPVGSDGQEIAEQRVAREGERQYFRSFGGALAGDSDARLGATHRLDSSPGRDATIAAVIFGTPPVV
jgi:hypothetical protein